MSSDSSSDLAEAVRRKQEQDAQRLFERLKQIPVPDLTVNYALEKSSVILPGVLVRFLVVAILFRLNSAKKWRLALDEPLLPEPMRQWLGIEELADLMERATVDWMPPRVFMDTLSWRVAECLTACGLPQPVAVIRQTIRELLSCKVKVSEGGIVLDRRFWRQFVAGAARPLSPVLATECRERIDFVLGQVDLAEVMDRRWLEVPELSEAQRVTLEAARVAEPSQQLQALREAFAQGHFDFVVPLLVCSYSQYGRRPHHPLLMWKVWLAMLAMGASSPATFLNDVDDSLQLRLFLEAMSQRELPSARRIKGFAAERMAPVIEYLVELNRFAVEVRAASRK